jgi:hypothetical protein
MKLDGTRARSFFRLAKTWQPSQEAPLVWRRNSLSVSKGAALGGAGGRALAPAPNGAGRARTPFFRNQESAQLGSLGHQEPDVFGIERQLLNERRHPSHGSP